MVNGIDGRMTHRPSHHDGGHRLTATCPRAVDAMAVRRALDCLRDIAAVDACFGLSPLQG